MLILTQLLDNTLEHALLRFMQPFNKDTRWELFRGMGALSTFSAKIHVAYGVGLLDKKAYKDAHTLRKIRNKFAHTDERLSLDDQVIKDLMKELSTSGEGVRPNDAISRAVESVSRNVNIALHERTKGDGTKKEDTKVDDE